MTTTLQEQDNLLAEKCRIALEKHYGFEIPMPKAIIKSQKKKITFEVRWMRMFTTRMRFVSSKINKTSIRKPIRKRWNIVKYHCLKWFPVIYYNCYSFLAMAFNFLFVIWATMTAL